MAFILEPTVINIKLTDKGRELLSRGQLTFDQFAVGDGEIDYEFFNEIGFDAFEANMMQPKDNHPSLPYFITKEVSGTTLNSLSTVVSNTSIITNTPPDRGFFSESGGTFTIQSDPNWTKQADMAIEYSNVNGGNNLSINQSTNYPTNSAAEPVIGDLILVKWGNPDLGDTVGFDVDQNIPYIWYKIEDIISGTLAGDDLIVEVDKPLPDFSGSGGGSFAGALLYPNSNNRLLSGDSVQTYYGSPFVTDFVSESILTFLENCDTPTIDVPVWSMHIAIKKEIEGVQLSGRSISEYFSRTYSGFIQYIQRVSPTVERIGLIHYSNGSPSNNYGEGFVQDTPILELPTIMWHKNTSGTIGMTLRTVTAPKLLPDLNTSYQDLYDDFGNIVGKVFLDLQLFVIEDQELLYAMSYKANRSWTLPPVITGFNTANCPPSDVMISGSVTP